MSAPKQYLQGYSEFYKLRFMVTPDVLIPRPETELLVDEVLDFVNRKSRIAYRKGKTSINPLRGLSEASDIRYTIYDIGTGCGCIAISIAKNLPKNTNIRIIASDVSAPALIIAKQNAKLHQVEDRIGFIQSNLLSSKSLQHYLSHSRSNRESSIMDPREGGDDKNGLVIVTNLPYIPSSRIPYLDSSVKDFEPQVALDGGEDGFGLYRKLFQQLNKTGITPNLLIGEIDYTHGESAVIEAQKYFPEATVEVKKDLAHRQRILFIATKPLL